MIQNDTKKPTAFRKRLAIYMAKLTAKVMPKEARLFSVIMFLGDDSSHILDTTAMPRDATMGIVKMIYAHGKYSEFLKNGDLAGAQKFLDQITASEQAQDKPMIH